MTPWPAERVWQWPRDVEYARVKMVHHAVAGAAAASATPVQPGVIAGADLDGGRGGLRAGHGAR